MKYYYYSDFFNHLKMRKPFSDLWPLHAGYGRGWVRRGVGPESILWEGPQVTTLTLPCGPHQS